MHEIRDAIRVNERLKIEPDAPILLSKMIIRCWDGNPKERPEFAGLAKQLESDILLLHLASPVVFQAVTMTKISVDQLDESKQLDNLETDQNRDGSKKLDKNPNARVNQPQSAVVGDEQIINTTKDELPKTAKDESPKMHKVPNFQAMSIKKKMFFMALGIFVLVAIVVLALIINYFSSIQSTAQPEITETRKGSVVTTSVLMTPTAVITADLLTSTTTTTTFTVSVHASTFLTTSINQYVTVSTTSPTATPAIIVSTFVGTGQRGYLDAQGTLASFNYPVGITTDSSGSFYIADSDNHKIRKITYSGLVSTIAGSGSIGAGDGAASISTFRFPAGITIDSFGFLYIADTYNNMIRKITPTGDVSTLAGNGTVGSADGDGALATFNLPNGIAVDLDGNLYVTDSMNNKIRKVFANGTVITFAGSGIPGSTNGQGVLARFSNPCNIIIDAAGVLYVADTYSNKIRNITLSGYVDTVAGSSQGSVNGPISLATFYWPRALALDSSGNLYVGDNNQKIRKISTSGMVTTLAGNGSIGAVDGLASEATFFDPRGIAFGSDGNMYLTDSTNYKIRKISLI